MFDGIVVNGPRVPLAPRATKLVTLYNTEMSLVGKGSSVRFVPGGHVKISCGQLDTSAEHTVG